MQDERLKEDTKQLLQVAYERRVVDGAERMQVDLAASASWRPDDTGDAVIERARAGFANH